MTQQPFVHLYTTAVTKLRPTHTFLEFPILFSCKTFLHTTTQLRTLLDVNIFASLISLQNSLQILIFKTTSSKPFYHVMKNVATNLLRTSRLFTCTNTCIVIKQLCFNCGFQVLTCSHTQMVLVRCTITMMMFSVATGMMALSMAQ